MTSEILSVERPGPEVELIQGLQIILGDTCRVLRATEICHWNIGGRGALMAVKALEAQALELNAALRDIAFLIRSIEGSAIPRYENAFSVEDLESFDEPLSPGRSAEILIPAHEEALLSIRAAIDLTLDGGDAALGGSLGARQLAHMRHISMLQLV